MKSLVLVLVFLCAAVLAAEDEQKCRADFQSFLVCVKDEFKKKPDAEKEAAKKERRDKAEKCFATAGCDAPDWDADLTGKGGRPPSAGMEMPKSVKDCLKKKMVEKLGSKLNDCLSKKGVKNLNFSALAESAEGSGLEVEAQANEDAAKEGVHGAFKAKFNTVKAVDKCAQKKGGDTNSVKPLEQCLHDIKKSQKPKLCALVKPCEDKAAADCKKRGQEIRQAICQCKKEKEADISKKLKSLGESQKKVGIPDLIKTVADDEDVQEIMKQVDICYSENNETEPPMLKLAMQVLARSGGTGGPGAAAFQAALSVNASTVVIMSDMLALDAQDDSECQPCP